MVTKLNQIVAVEKGVKSDVYGEITKAYHQIQKIPLFAGFTRNYRPAQEDGDVLPGETKLIQMRGEEILTDIARQLGRLFDVTATKDFTNTKAVADIVVDGVTLVSNVPVPYLLFLEKQLKDLDAFVRKLPVLDPAREWTYDPNTSAQRAAVETTKSTKKVPRNHVKAPATDKHPAQVEVYQEDVLVGFWDVTHYSGSLPLDRVKTLLERINTLTQAVKMAREQANMTDVIDGRGTGKKIFDYILGE